MEATPLLLAGLALLATAAVFVALSRSNSLARVRAALGAADSADPETAARAVVARAATAEASARAIGEEFDRLLDVVAGTIKLSNELTVASANRAAHQLLGRPPGSLVGLTALEAFADHRIEDVARRARELGGSSAELQLRGAADLILLVRARRAPDGIWLLLEDVSELRRLQRIRTEFIDNLSHELRTPLTTVRLLTETLALDLENADVPPRIRDRVAKIDVETGHLVQMVTELLDLSRIESGAARLHLADVDVRAVTRGALDRLALFAERQGVRLSHELPAELPLIRGDEDRLGQLLLNLVHNAVKFSGPDSEVSVSASTSEREVVVSVRDRGPGIARADLERIFERFYKVDKARVRGGGGTGLGLAIARHIVESHGGRIWAESEEGHGSTFSFAIPRADVAAGVPTA